MSGPVVSSFSSNKDCLSHFLTGRKECTVLYTSMQQKKAQDILWLWNVCKRVCTCPMFVTASWYIGSTHVPVSVCVCVYSVGVSSHTWRQSLYSRILGKDTFYMCVCSFWVNWLKLPFSLGQSLFIFSLLSGHTLRGQNHSNSTGKTRTWVKTQQPPSFTLAMFLYKLLHLVFVAFSFIRLVQLQHQWNRGWII